MKPPRRALFGCLHPLSRISDQGWAAPRSQPAVDAAV